MKIGQFDLATAVRMASMVMLAAASAFCALIAFGYAFISILLWIDGILLFGVSEVSLFLLLVALAVVFCYSAYSMWRSR